MSLKKLFKELIIAESQKSLASQIPINEKTFSANLTGRSRPTIRNARKYISFLESKGIRTSLNEIYE
jgi:DNA-binding XRE family transcriptional regulator